MSAYRTARISPALWTVVCVLALLAVACTPAATPTPTSAPTSAPTAAPTEEEAEPTEEMVEDAPTEAVEEEADATEMADDGDADATEEADADVDVTEAASGDATAGEGMPGVVGVTSTRVREAPAVRGTVIVEIPAGTAVVALGQTANEGYLFIRLEDGAEGWVSKQTINLEDRFAALPIIDPES